MSDSFSPRQTDPAKTAPLPSDPTNGEGELRAGFGHAPQNASAAAMAATRRLTWLFVGLMTLLLLRFFVPYMVEQLQFAIAKGKLRAEMEAAETGLGSLQLDQLSKAFQFVSRRVAPSVVNINVSSDMETVPDDDLAELFGPQNRLAEGQGSGVIVEPDGYILTNSHVVKGAIKIEVSLADGRVLPARAVGVDTLTDLALLKVDAKDLIPVEWGDSNELETGALVWAVGSPFGLQQSITAGILSGKNRPGKSGAYYYDFLQTDAAVNPGNSGGPLVDAHGRVIGINTAIVGDVFQGISFAIPSNEARNVYQRLRVKGRVERGWLGVSLADVNATLAKQLGFSGEQGAIVMGINRDSPAQQAGLRPSDIILKWNGQEIIDSTTLSRLVARTKVGSIAEVELWRHGKPVTVKITVTERPANLN